MDDRQVVLTYADRYMVMESQLTIHTCLYHPCSSHNTHHLKVNSFICCQNPLKGLHVNRVKDMHLICVRDMHLISWSMQEISSLINFKDRWCALSEVLHQTEVSHTKQVSHNKLRFHIQNWGLTYKTEVSHNTKYKTEVSHTKLRSHTQNWSLTKLRSHTQNWGLTYKTEVSHTKQVSFTKLRSHSPNWGLTYQMEVSHIPLRCHTPNTILLVALALHVTKATWHVPQPSKTKHQFANN